MEENNLDIIQLGKFRFYEYFINGPKIIDSYLDYNEEGILNINTLNLGEINISRKRETSHFFINGAPGTGKTVLLFPLIEQIRYRQDKIFLYDIKGDYTQNLSEIEGNELILLAPWDKRGYVWKIGEDLFNSQLAREFANKIIKDGEEPLYSSSARLIMSGVIYYLQYEYKSNWTVKTLVEKLVSPREELYEILKHYAPEAAETIREPTKLTQNIMTNLLSSIDLLTDLAKAWDDDSKNTFSIRELIKREEPFTFIMQGSGIYKNLANSLIQSIITSVSAEIEMLEDDFNRRIWFFMDEFPQLGFIKDFNILLEIGRSKGICVVLAIQNINQLIHIYGEDLANSIQSMCATHIYGRLSIGKSSNLISEMLGMKEVIRKSPVLNQSDVTNGFNISREIVPAVHQFFLTKELGDKNDGIFMLLSGYGNEYYKIKIPYTNVVKNRERYIFEEWAI